MAARWPPARSLPDRNTTPRSRIRAQSAWMSSLAKGAARPRPDSALSDGSAAELFDVIVHSGLATPARPA